MNSASHSGWAHLVCVGCSRVQGVLEQGNYSVPQKSSPPMIMPAAMRYQPKTAKLWDWR